MPDREKVIRGLECCTHGVDKCAICPYDPRYNEIDEINTRSCMTQLAMDTLELLKAQETRVLTLEDVMEIYNARDSHVWPYDTAPFIFVEEHPDIYTYHGSWTAWREIMAILLDGIFVHTRNTYGKTWRCWSARPTDEQRKAVKWK